MMWWKRRAPRPPTDANESVLVLVLVEVDLAPLVAVIYGPVGARKEFEQEPSLFSMILHIHGARKSVPRSRETFTVISESL